MVVKIENLIDFFSVVKYNRSLFDFSFGLLMARRFRKTSHSKYDLKVHLVWVNC